MKIKIVKVMQMIALLFSVHLFAAEQTEIKIYPGEGFFEQNFSTFPEMPEWKANWGNQGGLMPPYIRFSGQKEASSDWNTRLVFQNFPQKVSKGILEMNLFATENITVGIKLENSSKESLYSLKGGQSKQIKLSLDSLFNGFPQKISYIDISLKNVPARHYLTFLVGNISLMQESSMGNVTIPVLKEASWQFSETDFKKSFRKTSEDVHVLEYPRNAYSKAEKDSLIWLSETGIFLQESSDWKMEIVKKDSAYLVSNFRDKLYRLGRNLLKDSVIANPKYLWNVGKKVASANDLSLLPIIAADVVYETAECDLLLADSSCGHYSVKQRRFLGAAPVLGIVRGSKVRLVSDPYFWITNSQENEKFLIEVYVAGKNYVLDGASSIEIEFSELGIHEMKIRVHRNSSEVEQKFLVEVQ